MAPILRVRSLSVVYAGNGLQVPAVRDVSFDVDRGEAVGILGESGSGKTTLALTLLQLLPRSGRIVSGSIQFNGRELAGLREKELESVRGAQLSLVFQEPAISLNPVMRVGAQIANVMRAHRRGNRAACHHRAKQLLAEVGLSDTARIYEAYPHELSSGQKQRVAIAQAICCEPAIIIADEPTANLDIETQTQILQLLTGMKARYDLGILLITHNPGLLAGFADRIMVMYAGQIVEQGPREPVLTRPLHPYTVALLGCMPGDRAMTTSRARLIAIPGDPPDLAKLTDACSFENRCGYRQAICRSRIPDVTQPIPGQSVRCFVPRVT
jgi:oligopeptide/dipeptide ABC transporter ATP-binding protein